MKSGNLMLCLVVGLAAGCSSMPDIRYVDDDLADADADAGAADGATVLDGALADANVRCPTLRSGEHCCFENDPDEAAFPCQGPTCVQPDRDKQEDVCDECQSSCGEGRRCCRRGREGKDISCVELDRKC